MMIRPGENTGRTKELKELSIEGRELKTSREPSSLIQLIDVRDCVNQIVEAVISRSQGPLNIATPPVQMTDFIDVASRAFGGPELEIEYRSSVDEIPFARHPYYLSQNSVNKEPSFSESLYDIFTSLSDWSNKNRDSQRVLK